MMQTQQHRARITGFTLLDLVVSLTLIGLLMSLIAPLAYGAYQEVALQSTADELTARLRLAQAMASSSESSGSLWLNPYIGDYRLLRGAATIEQDSFYAPVQYKDGYLQLVSGRITYDNLGNAQTAGKIQLVDGNHEVDILLYMGCGLEDIQGVT